MTKIITRPDYISYHPLREGREDDFNKLENEVALFQWESSRVFLWHDGPWLHHLKLISGFFIFVGGPILLFSDEFYHFLLVFFIACIVPLLFVYYIGRSQYHHVAYKISESGILIDILKIYPRFRYGRQDTTKVMHFLRVIAFILIIVALVVNPLYLIGAGGAVFVSFIKPAVDEGEKASYMAFLWDKDKVLDKNDDNKICKINIIPRRRIIYIACNRIVKGAIIHCSKDNFKEICFFMKEKFPDVDFVQEKLPR
jgi:hypothetical protein